MELSCRKPTRMREFDYTAPNYYFITICTDQRKNLFYSNGNINGFGGIAAEYLEQIQAHFPQVRVDKYVVMPNHIHGIIQILGKQTYSISTVVSQYKASVFRKIHAGNPHLCVWQRSFHDHVIRNYPEYLKIWNYIDKNPVMWEKDCFYNSDYLML